MLEVTVRVACPFGATLVGLIVPVRPLDVDTVRSTLLLNPLTAPMFMVEVADAPAETLRLDGLAEIVKSGWFEKTVTGIVIACDNDPLVPVTVIVYEPGGVDDVVGIVSVEFPVPPEARVMLVGLKLGERPVGETESVRLTVPANPPRLVSVMG